LSNFSRTAFNRQKQAFLSRHEVFKANEKRRKKKKRKMTQNRAK
jgi:hypothetical protein